MTRTRFVYLCNAIDETTCRERRITSDSPAATQKVLQVCNALATTGVRPIVLSMGRGQQQGTWAWHRARVRRIGTNVVVFAPFLDAPLLTHLVTLLGLLPLIWRLFHNSQPAPVLLAYNRLPHYLLGLELARLLGYRLFLDLEDGEIRSGPRGIRGQIFRIVGKRFHRLCQAGALLASEALAIQYPGNNTMCCYGVAEATIFRRNWKSEKLIVHLGGTLQADTGADLFIDTIELLREKTFHERNAVEFVVTGRGVMAEKIDALAARPGWPKVIFLGSVPREKYQEIIASAHIGLCLKLPSGDLGDTTFPSKVVEIASAGMLLVTTEVSDVPKLFGRKGALYLKAEEARNLADSILWVLDHRSAAASIAKEGQRQISASCERRAVGAKLKHFFFNSSMSTGGHI
jgi:hypothetical protein